MLPQHQPGQRPPLQCVEELHCGVAGAEVVPVPLRQADSDARRRSDADHKKHLRPVGEVMAPTTADSLLKGSRKSSDHGSSMCEIAPHTKSVNPPSTAPRIIRLAIVFFAL